MEKTAAIVAMVAGKRNIHKPRRAGRSEEKGDRGITFERGVGSAVQ